MNENHNNHFFDGLVLGLVIGGLAVFLFGTKSGKNILRKISEEGVEGIEDLLENYHEEEDIEEERTAPVEEEVKIEEVRSNTKDNAEVLPKKRFFKRFKRVD